MHKNLFTAVALLPFLLSGSQAAQRWTMNPYQPMGIPSVEFDSGGYLGVQAVDMTPDRLGELKLKEEQGVEVTMVDQDAPAAKAGVKEHDVILTVNGTPLEGKSQLHRMIREIPAGRTVALGLSRDGQPLTIKVQLADSNQEFSDPALTGKNLDHDFHFKMPAVNLPDFDLPNIAAVYVHSSMRSGVMVENLTPQLGEFFGAKSGNGVLVRSVEKGSRAEKAGLRAGDVIVRVGDQTIHDTGDFTHSLQSRQAGSVKVGVIRDKKEQSFTLSLPEQKRSGELIEEGLELPDLDAESQAELSDLRDEIAKLRPQMQIAKKVSAEIQAEMRGRAQEMKRDAGKARQQIEPRIREEFRKEMKNNGEDMQREREELQRELQENSSDI